VSSDHQAEDPFAYDCVNVSGSGVTAVAAWYY
jgi:hypothetical protein